MKVELRADGPSLSRIVAGVMKWGAWGANLSTKQMTKLIDECVGIDVTSFDHADIYGGHTTEAEFGKAFKESRLDRTGIEIITKCGICYPSAQRPDIKIHSYNTSTSYIIASAERSLKNLQTDYIDLLLIHRPSPVMNYSEMAEAFHLLQESGKILYGGVSNFTPSQFEQFLAFFPLATNQIEASVLHLDPFFDGSLDIHQKHNIKPMAWSALGGGSLFKKSSQYTEILQQQKLYECSINWNTPLDKLAYAFLLRHPVGILPVTGSSKIERIQTAVDAMSYDMSEEQWLELWKASSGKTLA